MCAWSFEALLILTYLVLEDFCPALMAATDMREFFFFNAYFGLSFQQSLTLIFKLCKTMQVCVIAVQCIHFLPDLWFKITFPPTFLLHSCIS